MFLYLNRLSNEMICILVQELQNCRFSNFEVRIFFRTSSLNVGRFATLWAFRMNSRRVYRKFVTVHKKFLFNIIDLFDQININYTHEATKLHNLLGKKLLILFLLTAKFWASRKVVYVVHPTISFQSPN